MAYLLQKFPIPHTYTPHALGRIVSHSQDEESSALDRQRASGLFGAADFAVNFPSVNAGAEMPVLRTVAPRTADEPGRIRQLFDALQERTPIRFPAAGGKLKAPKRRGVYVIYGPKGRVLHVGMTPRAKNGIFQRLRDHLAGRSSFTREKYGRDGSRLRNGCSFRCLIVASARQRALLEAYAIGALCPWHIGDGSKCGE